MSEDEADEADKREAEGRNDRQVEEKSEMRAVKILTQH